MAEANDKVLKCKAKCKTVAAKDTTKSKANAAVVKTQLTLKERAFEYVSKGVHNVQNPKPGFSEKTIGDGLVTVVPVDRTELRETLAELVREGRLVLQGGVYMPLPVSAAIAKKTSSGKTGGAASRKAQDIVQGAKKTRKNDTDMTDGQT